MSIKNQDLKIIQDYQVDAKIFLSEIKEKIFVKSGEVNKIFYLFAYIFVIRPGLKKYLKSVLLGLEWYLKNQRPTPNNQFGNHKWFSLVD